MGRAIVLRRLEQAHRATLENHVYRAKKLGEWVLINARWYYSIGLTRSALRNHDQGQTAARQRGGGEDASVVDVTLGRRPEGSLRVIPQADIREGAE